MGRSRALRINLEDFIILPQFDPVDGQKQKLFCVVLVQGWGPVDKPWRLLVSTFILIVQTTGLLLQSGSDKTQRVRPPAFAGRVETGEMRSYEDRNPVSIHQGALFVPLKEGLYTCLTLISSP